MKQKTLNLLILLLLFVFLAICAITVNAQDTVKIYATFANANYSGSEPSLNTRGINAGASLKLYDYEHVKLEAVGDFSVFRLFDDDEAKIYRYLAGPQVSLTLLDYKLSPFVQVLFGRTTYYDQNYYTVSYGGGLDVNVTRRFFVRAFQYNKETATGVPSVDTVKAGVGFKF